MSTEGRRRRHAGARGTVSLALAVVVLGCIGVAAWWALSGGRWYVVRTPSMGTAAPVGTLLWVEPTAASDLHVGDIITFRPPGLTTTYSHRIFSIAPNGAMHTKGDANAGPDTWTLHSSDLVGRVAARWWGIGWLIRATPILALGGLLLYALVRWATPPSLRVPAAVVGCSFLLSLAIFVYRPLVGADKIAVLPTNPGVQASYVSTGLLPLRLHAEGGSSVHLRAGEQGTVRSTKPTHGRLRVGLRPVLPWWWWVLILAPWFAPALWSTLASGVGRPDPRHRAVLA